MQRKMLKQVASIFRNFAVNCKPELSYFETEKVFETRISYDVSKHNIPGWF